MTTNTGKPEDKKAECTNCGRLYNKYCDWTNCGVCAKEAYTIFDDVGYEHIQHSGGCFPLVKVDISLNCEQEKYIVDRGWRKSGSFCHTDGLHYHGPWSEGISYSVMRDAIMDNFDVGEWRIVSVEDED